jgi:hypothetical protein
MEKPGGRPPGWFGGKFESPSTFFKTLIDRPREYFKEISLFFKNIRVKL